MRLFKSNVIILIMENIVYGNIEGIKDSVLKDIQYIYEIETGSDQFVSNELIETMARLSAKINREIMVYLSRNGKVAEVRVGDDKSVGLTELRLVRNYDRLSGVRCIHTHPSGSGYLSDVDKGSLSSLKLDSMAAIGVSKDGYAVDFYAGFLGEEAMDGSREVLLHGPFHPSHIPQSFLLDEIFESDNRFLGSAYTVTECQLQKAILCGIERDSGYDSLAELESLAETAGVITVGRLVQNKNIADPLTYIGHGKAEELLLLCNSLEADCVIFDDELSAIQMRNLETIVGTDIIDRTMLILDIFAQRASSREGKLQVELAQLKYRLPRLLGMGRVLSRQGGGVGTRGPGEKKLEIDRRRIRRRIFELEKEIDAIGRQRELRKLKRKNNKLPLVALVGYTNAGKSTLLNLLTDSKVLSEDKLFATLDPVVRSMELPDNGTCLIADTVGFINKLPHDLIDAFKSTLEEVKDADLLLHVIDSGNTESEMQISVVENVIASLGASNIPCIRVYNKMDVCSIPVRKDGIKISAVTGEGIDALLDQIGKELKGTQIKVDLLIDYSKYDALIQIKQFCTVLEEKHEENGTLLSALVSEEMIWKINKLLDL